MHEAGHQFWYGLVGNNEFEAAWLDEGFNSFTDSEVMIRRYGPRRATTDYSGTGRSTASRRPRARAATVLAERALGPAHPAARGSTGTWSPCASPACSTLWRDQPQLTLGGPLRPIRAGTTGSRYLGDPDRDPIDTHRVEVRRPLGLLDQQLPAHGGDPALAARRGRAQDRFLRGMRHYAETWRFDHPYPDDFFAAFNEGAGVDVSWYFDDLFRGTGTVDWSVTVDQRETEEARGWFQESPGAPFVELVTEEEDEPAPEQETDEEQPQGEEAEGGTNGDGGRAPEETDGTLWSSEVVVLRRGELRLPLTIELRFDDDTVERRTWSREEQAGKRWMRIRMTGERKLTAVLLDPDRAYYLDTDMSNNSWFDAVDELTPLRWTERVFNRYAHLLFWQAGIGG